jgi:hypothetical protein
MGLGPKVGKSILKTKPHKSTGEGSLVGLGLSTRLIVSMGKPGPFAGGLGHSKINEFSLLPGLNFGTLETIHEGSSDFGTDDSEYARSMPEGVTGEYGSTSGGLGLTVKEGDLQCSTIEDMPVRKESLHTHSDCA